MFVVCEVSTHKGGCSSIMGDIWVSSQSRHIDPAPPSLFIDPRTMTKGRHLPGIYTVTENKQVERNTNNTKREKLNTSHTEKGPSSVKLHVLVCNQTGGQSSDSPWTSGAPAGLRGERCLPR